MRTGVLIGTKHDGKSVLIMGEEVPVNEQKDKAREIASGGEVNKDYRRITLFTSDQARSYKFVSPAEAKAKEQTAKRLEREAKAREEAKNKTEEKPGTPEGAPEPAQPS